MVALKVGSYAFPREQAAMMSGIASGSWSLVNFILLQAIGPRSNLMNNQQWESDLLDHRAAARGRHRRLAGAEPQSDCVRADRAWLPDHAHGYWVISGSGVTIARLPAIACEISIRSNGSR